MPNRLFQGIINQMREVLDRTIGVVDESGTVIACSELGQIGEARKGIISAGVFSGAQICVDNQMEHLYSHPGLSEKLTARLFVWNEALFKWVFSIIRYLYKKRWR